MTAARLAVVGGGLAGSLLAWRLARAAVPVDLFTGPAAADATDASGGLVRGFEVDPVAGRLAAASLAELTASRTLARWSRYREIGSVYVCAGADPEDLRVRLSDVAEARLVPADRLGGACGGFPDGAWAVVERRAGFIRPAALRRSVLDDLRRSGVRTFADPVTGIRPAGGPYTVGARGREATYHVVVLATGAWTPELLDRSSLPNMDLRTKHIQYGLYGATGEPLPSFVDDTTGLYGRGADDGEVLLGVPSAQWDVPPQRARPRLDLQRQAEALARQRLPGLRLGPLRRVVAGADAYGPDGHLALRPVPGQPGLFTFTGGAGGSAKLALAASADAARQLTLVRLSPTGVPA